MSPARGSACRRQRRPAAVARSSWRSRARDGPADRAGIAPGDIIVRIGEKPVTHAQEARSVITGVEPGTHVLIEIVRNGARTTVDVGLLPVRAQQVAR